MDKKLLKLALKLQKLGYENLSKKLLTVLHKNYDYGEGLFSNMKKYKSITDYLKYKKSKP